MAILVGTVTTVKQSKTRHIRSMAIRRLEPRWKETKMTKKLPLWKDRNISENTLHISDQELADRVQQHHANCLLTIKKIKAFTNENK